MSKQISVLKKTQDMENQVHSDTVKYLKDKAEQLTALSEYWENKYQEDLEAKENELEELKANREADVDTLTSLKERWDQEQAEKAAREAEERRLIELEKLRKEEQAAQDAAARAIQKKWEQHKLAEAAKDKKKPKGKKGKKKKKK